MPKDGVARNQVPCRGRVILDHPNSIVTGGAVVSDDVAFILAQPADEVVESAHAEGHAVAQIIQPSHSVGAGADEISLHFVCRGRGAQDVNAGVGISRDEIAGAKGWPTDQIRGTGEDSHAVTGVAQGGSAGKFCADEVAKNLISR